MPTYRGIRVNWKKPFKLCQEKSKFDQIEITDKAFPTFAVPLEKHEHDLIRQNLYPQLKIVVPLVDPKKFSYFSANYIRSYRNIRVAFQKSYQLSQTDCKFLKNHQQQLKAEDQTMLDSHLMKQVIIFLEKKAKVGGQLKLKQKWLLPLIQKGQKSRNKYININKIQLLLLSHWKQRRQTFIFPLYRPLWKNLNSQDILYVYRPRGKKQFQKLTEVDEENIKEQLCQQIEQTSMICQSLRARQSLNQKRIKQRIEKLEEWAKIYIFQQEFNSKVAFGQLATQIQINKDQTTIQQTSQMLKKCIVKEKIKDIESKQITCQGYLTVPTSLSSANLKKSNQDIIIPEILVSNKIQQISEDVWQSANGLSNQKASAKQSQVVSEYQTKQ